MRVNKRKEKEKTENSIRQVEKKWKAPPPTTWHYRVSAFSHRHCCSLDFEFTQHFIIPSNVKTTYNPSASLERLKARLVEL